MARPGLFRHASLLARQHARSAWWGPGIPEAAAATTASSHAQPISPIAGLGIINQQAPVNHSFGNASSSIHELLTVSSGPSAQPSWPGPPQPFQQAQPCNASCRHAHEPASCGSAGTKRPATEQHGSLASPWPAPQHVSIHHRGRRRAPNAWPVFLPGSGGHSSSRSIWTARHLASNPDDFLQPTSHLGTDGLDACTEAASFLAASITEGMAGGDGAGVQHRSAWFTALRAAAGGVAWVHDTTGLPWWASIPLTTLVVRTSLLPFSMWQARTVRTNYQVYREALELTDKQLGTTKEAGTSPTEGETAARLHRTKALLTNFSLLRTKLEAPHPLWILVNPLVQLPVFILLGGSLRLMAGVHWPGLSTGGALWFQDLTQVALIPGSHLFSSDTTVPWTLPMGAAGFVLPLTMLTMTLTSMRLGFGATGASLAPPPQDTIGKAMRMLPYVLCCLTVLNTWVALQLPHAPLLHWVASSSFTLSLQLALQQPKFRAAFNLPTPAELQAALSRAVNQRLQQLSEVGGTLGPGRGYAVSSLPDTLLKQVAGEPSADILVVLGAQHSAQRRYREALYCLDRALQLEPQHVRAHYSRGQVFSLNNRWTDAESCFRRAAELATNPSEKGQALYCIATALHTQGKLERAVEVYREALPVWSNMPVVTYSLANALLELGRLDEAKAVVDEVLHGAGGAQRAGPFLKPLQALAAQIQAGVQRQQPSGIHTNP